MKPMHLFLGLATILAATLPSCTYNTITPPEEVHYHHYRNTSSNTSSNKSSSVSGGYSSNAPESFQAVTPPSSYSN